jgi:hypothetical protein
VASRPRDLTGQKFHYLKPLEYAGQGRWVCRCDCGELTNVTSSNLLAGRVKSCGCYRIELLSHNKDLWAEFMQWKRKQTAKPAKKNKRA